MKKNTTKHRDLGNESTNVQTFDAGDRLNQSRRQTCQCPMVRRSGSKGEEPDRRYSEAAPKA